MPARGSASPPNPSLPSAAAEEDKGTGLPGFRTWRRVYWVVFGSFVLWVLLLVLLGRVFH